MAEISFPNYEGNVVRVQDECYLYNRVEKGDYTNTDDDLSGTFSTCPECWAYYWTPAEVSTMLWLDASDLSTIIDTTNPGRVEQWNDKSGNDFHLTQPTLSLKPFTGVNDFSGLNVIYGNGSNYIENLVDTWPTMTGLICCTVAQLITGGNYNPWLYAVNSVSEGNGAWLLQREGPRLQINFNSGSGPTFEKYTGLNFSPGIWGAYWNGSRAYAVTNGDNGSGSGSTGDLDIDNFSLFRRGGDITEANIGEVVIIDSQDFDLRQQVEGYLAWKWNLVSVLPSGHPYKTYRP